VVYLERGKNGVPTSFLILGHKRDYSMDEEKILINGEWLRGMVFSVKNSPFDNRPIYKYIETDTNLVNSAVMAAKSAFQKWKCINMDSRKTLFQKFIEVLNANREMIVENIHLDMGKPKVEADVEVTDIIDITNFYINSEYPEFIKDKVKINNEIWPHKEAFKYRVPIGVYAFVKPWNYPFEIPLWGIIPVLLAGNTIVFKPSENTPKTGLLIGKLIKEAGFPDGVFNVITGGAKTGENLVNHSFVDAISFTGSTKTGMNIYNSLNKIKKLNLELGGKDVAIVTENADIDKAVSGVLWGAFSNNGQVCTATERILVHKNTYELFKEKLLIQVKSLRPSIDFGPIVNETQMNKVLCQIQDSISNGDKLLIGGKRIEDENFSNGFYLEPSVIEASSFKSSLWFEETFGPAVIIKYYETIDEAINWSNSLDYGLGASVWTEDKREAFEIADFLDCGMVWINEVNLPLPELAWCGTKQSAVGINLSRNAVIEATNLKVIHYDNDEGNRAWWFPYQ
jgi:acyl-CoA reductase-like NAD-dependent aldehyde dehydrogenase